MASDSSQQNQSNSTVRVRCPNLTCRCVLTVPSSARGHTVKCGSCGMKVRVPGGSKSSSAGENAA